MAFHQHPTYAGLPEEEVLVLVLVVLVVCPNGWRRIGQHAPYGSTPIRTQNPFLVCSSYSAFVAPLIEKRGPADWLSDIQSTKHKTTPW
jgi:hypothetical protein